MIDVAALLSRLGELPERPEPYASGTHSLWTDPRVAPGMLRAHLDPHTDAASRRPETVDASVHWIGTHLRPGSRILDLGCGPGLYTSRLAAAGHQVTGVDLSENSLQHARRQSPDVRYLLGDYRTLQLEKTFDAALLVYLDLGTFSPADTVTILARIRDWLAPGGLLFADVATPARRSGSEQRRDWSHSPAGFWADEPHLWLTRTLAYPDGPVYLDEHVVVTAEELRLYRVWERCYTVDAFTGRLADAGLGVRGVYGDLTGTPFHASCSPVLAVVAGRR
ncbi:class I SAM-dependent methyltransferase [Flindersiella endophytica]